MGIGRFAYTALLPPTQHALGMGPAVAGALASANLAGYLAGVLWARHVASRPARSDLLRLGLAVTALATGAGALTTAPLVWALLRAVAGVASGLVFVLASATALEVAAPAGLIYGGVGLGLALSGGVAALAPAAAGWGAPWLVLGLAAGLLGVPAWRRLAAIPPAPPHSSGPLGDPAMLGFGLTRLAIAYFLEGFGYIVSGTFAVAAVRATPGLEWLAPWTWVLTGLAAAPSAPLWAALGRRLGLRRALVLAHLTQALGMALPSILVVGGGGARRRGVLRRHVHGHRHAGDVRRSLPRSGLTGPHRREPHGHLRRRAGARPHRRRCALGATWRPAPRCPCRRRRGGAGGMLLAPARRAPWPAGAVGVQPAREVLPYVSRVLGYSD